MVSTWSSFHVEFRSEGTVVYCLKMFQDCSRKYLKKTVSTSGTL